MSKPPKSHITATGSGVTKLTSPQPLTAEQITSLLYDEKGVYFSVGEAVLDAILHAEPGKLTQEEALKGSYAIGISLPRDFTPTQFYTLSDYLGVAYKECKKEHPLLPAISCTPIGLDSNANSVQGMLLAFPHCTTEHDAVLAHGHLKQHIDQLKEHMAEACQVNGYHSRHGQTTPFRYH
jgi:hypothetical protein